MMSRDEYRFAEKIRVENDCWIWAGGLGGEGKKYAYFAVNGKTVRAVRWAYEEMIGEIPAGLTLDHLCKRTRCVNPFHCEPVTLRENILRSQGGVAAQKRRQTHCIHGHRLSGGNLLVRKDGRRNCRACSRQKENSS
jgi:hypothetical protein